MKGLNRLEYCALVSIVPKKKKKTEQSKGRNQTQMYEFGSGLREKIGSKYCQVLKTMQCTPKLFNKVPTHPGEKPLNPKKVRQWEKKAEKFAFHFLAMFRPEDKLYDYDSEI